MIVLLFLINIKLILIINKRYKKDYALNVIIFIAILCHILSINIKFLNNL